MHCAALMMWSHSVLIWLAVRCIINGPSARRGATPSEAPGELQTLPIQIREAPEAGPGWVIGRIGRVPGGPLHFWAGRDFFIFFICRVSPSSLKVGYTRSAF